MIMRAFSGVVFKFFWPKDCSIFVAWKLTEHFSRELETNWKCQDLCLLSHSLSLPLVLMTDTVVEVMTTLTLSTCTPDVTFPIILIILFHLPQWVLMNFIYCKLGHLVKEKKSEMFFAKSVWHLHCCCVIRCSTQWWWLWYGTCI